MSSFEWMELQSLTNDIELSRSRLAEARGRGDRGRIRALEEEITRAEKTRLQLLTHISTNIASAPESAATSKAKEVVEAAQASVALVAEALQGEAAEADLPDEPDNAPEPAPRKGRESAAARRASARAAEALPDEADEDDAGGAREPAVEAVPDEAAETRPLSERIAASPVASSVSAPKTDRKGGSTVWDQLTPGDLERAKNELGARRAEVLARHAEELRGLDAEQSQLETLEQAIEMFLQKMRGPAASTVVELRQQGNG